MWHGICWPLLSSPEIQAIQRHMQSGVSFYLVGVMSLLAQKVLGFTYVTPLTITLDVNEIAKWGSCFFIFALSHSLFHCWIKNQHNIYHLCFEHSLFHCCLMLTQMHRWGLLKVSVTAHIIPNCDFASVNFLFSICWVCSSFVLSVVFSSQIVRGKYFGPFWFRYACTISSLPTC